MSHGDGPPPMFEHDHFPYWIIWMESYLKACDVKCLKATTKIFAPPAKDTALTLLEQENEKWNAKDKHHIFRGLCKEVFNRVRNHKDAHELWIKLCTLHEGSKSEREERFHLVMYKLNTFKMLPKEDANEMYSRLNVIVEELNGLGLNKMSPIDVARKILCPTHWQIWAHSHDASSRRSLNHHTNIYLGEDQHSWDVHAYQPPR